MTILRWLREFIPSSSSESDDWPSIVLLLEKPVLPSSSEAVAIALKAWGENSQVRLEASLKGNHYILRSPEVYFALHAVSDRYEVTREEQTQVQDLPWQLHNAWLAIDLPNKRTDALKDQGSLGAAYRILRHFVNCHWSANCLAI